MAMTRFLAGIVLLCLFCQTSGDGSGRLRGEQIRQDAAQEEPVIRVEQTSSQRELFFTSQYQTKTRIRRGGPHARPSQMQNPEISTIAHPEQTTQTTQTAARTRPGQTAQTETTQTAARTRPGQTAQTEAWAFNPTRTTTQKLARTQRTRESRGGRPDQATRYPPRPDLHAYTPPGRQGHDGMTTSETPALLMGEPVIAAHESVPGEGTTPDFDTALEGPSQQGEQVEQDEPVEQLEEAVQYLHAESQVTAQEASPMMVLDTTDRPPPSPVTPVPVQPMPTLPFQTAPPWRPFLSGSNSEPRYQRPLPPRAGIRNPFPDFSAGLPQFMFYRRIGRSERQVFFGSSSLTNPTPAPTPGPSLPPPSSPVGPAIPSPTSVMPGSSVPTPNPFDAGGSIVPVPTMTPGAILPTSVPSDLGGTFEPSTQTNPNAVTPPTSQPSETGDPLMPATPNGTLMPSSQPMGAGGSVRPVAPGTGVPTVAASETTAPTRGLSTPVNETSAPTPVQNSSSLPATLAPSIANSSTLPATTLLPSNETNASAVTVAPSAEFTPDLPGTTLVPSITNSSALPATIPPSNGTNVSALPAATLAPSTAFAPDLAITLAPSLANASSALPATLPPLAGMNASALPGTLAPSASAASGLPAATLGPATLAASAGGTLGPTTLAQCMDNPRDYQIGIDIQPTFSNGVFLACQEAENAFILITIQDILNANFKMYQNASLIDWVGTANFGPFQFDPAQTVSNTGTASVAPLRRRFSPILPVSTRSDMPPQFDFQSINGLPAPQTGSQPINSVSRGDTQLDFQHIEAFHAPQPEFEPVNGVSHFEPTLDFQPINSNTLPQAEFQPINGVSYLQPLDFRPINSEAVPQAEFQPINDMPGIDPQLAFQPINGALAQHAEFQPINGMYDNDPQLPFQSINGGSVAQANFQPINDKSRGSPNRDFQLIKGVPRPHPESRPNKGTSQNWRDAEPRYAPRQRGFQRNKGVPPNSHGRPPRRDVQLLQNQPPRDRLLQTGTCPPRPGVCTANACLLACGVAKTTFCGTGLPDTVSWQFLVVPVADALAALGFPCMGTGAPNVMMTAM